MAFPWLFLGRRASCVPRHEPPIFPPRIGSQPSQLLEACAPDSANYPADIHGITDIAVMEAVVTCCNMFSVLCESLVLLESRG